MSRPRCWPHRDPERQTLLVAVQHERAAECVRRAFASQSYDAVLALCFDYVEVE